MTVPADIVAGACALLFVAAVAGKIDSWTSWSRLTTDLPGPQTVGHVVRVALPLLEGLIVVLCFARPVAGLAAGAIVLAGFAAAVFVLARRLPDRECNCFGAIAPATINVRLAWRNLGLAVLAGGGWYLAARENLQALGMPKVAATVLLGVIALMGSQYWHLRHAVRLGQRG